MNINLKENSEKISGYFFERKKDAGMIGKFAATKKKRIAVLTLVFLTLFISLMPAHEARAAWYDPIVKLFAGAAGLFIFNFMNLALFVTVEIVHFGAYLIDIMVMPSLYKASFSSVAVQTGWTAVRDFCNMFFIFFLLMIAFSTILRMSEYSAKNILPKFLIAIFVINFSQEITKLVIDFGQVFMYEFLSWMGGSFSGSSGGGTNLTFIADYFYSKYHFGLQYSFDAVVAITFAVAYTFILGFMYIILAGFLLVRLVALVVYIIFSPFAIFSMVFPSTRKYTSEWQSGLVRYTMFGPVFMFFVYLSSVMANSLQSSTDLTSSITGVPGYSEIGFADILTTLIPNVVALGVLVSAIPMAMKSGAIAGSASLVGGRLGIGSAVMGSWGAAKLAGGWGKKIGGGVDNRLLEGKVSEWGRNQQKKVYGALGMHGTIMVTEAGLQREREKNMKELRDRYGTPSENTPLETAIAMGKKWNATSENKAYALETIAAHGKLNDPKHAKDIKEFLPAAEKALNGKEMKAITNKSLTLSTETTEGKKRIKEIETDPDKAEGLSKELKADIKDKKITAVEAVKMEKMADLIREGKTHEVQDMDNESTARIWYDAQDSDQRKSSINRMAKDQRERLAEGLLKNVRRVKDGKLVDSKGEELKVDGKKFNELDDDKKRELMEEYDKKYKDNKYGIDAVKLGRTIEEAFVSGSKDFEDHVKKALNTFGAKDLAKMNKKDQVSYFHHLNDSQLKDLNRKSEYDTINRTSESIKNRMAMSGVKEIDKKELGGKLKKIDNMLTGTEESKKSKKKGGKQTTLSGGNAEEDEEPDEE